MARAYGVPVIVPAGIEVVYFVRSGHQGAIKIGFSCSLSARLESMQTGNPDELVFLGYFEGSKWDEKRIHSRFEHLRFRGEWFWPADELLEFIKNNTTTKPIPLGSAA